MICASVVDLPHVLAQPAVSATAAGSISAIPPEHGILRIYARDGDTRIKLISDDHPVPEADRLFDISFFATSTEAGLVAAACADYLARSGLGADDEGWHPFAARHLPKLLWAARNIWSGLDTGLVATASCREEPQPTAVAVAPERKSRPWPRKRDARLCFMAGQGYTAKQIADDPQIASTPNNVYQRAYRLGIALSDATQGHVSFRLPIGALVVVDRAAAAIHLTRDTYLRRWVIQGARDPARYGMVVVSG